jgi:hypothetical protein
MASSIFPLLRQQVKQIASKDCATLVPPQIKNSAPFREVASIEGGFPSTIPMVAACLIRSSEFRYR